MNNKPIQYQKGYVEFYKLKFKVTPDVLIPRPETELLVDEVLNILRSEQSESRSHHKNIIASKVSSRLRSNNNQHTIILDLGTGAGNIAISIAKNAQDVKIIATDISGKALKVAKQNAKLHGVEDRITFIQSDLLSNVIPANAGIQLSELSEDNSPRLLNTSSSELDPRLRGDDKLIIVTNLPYIPSERIPYLDSSVKDFEPHVALDGGEDGFGLYRKLFQQLKEKGWTPELLIGEVDYTHGELAANEAQKYFPKAEIEVKKDLAHMQRILLIWHTN